MSVTCKIKVDFDMILLFSFVNTRQNGNTHKMRNGNALAIQIHLTQYYSIILLYITEENLNNNSHPDSQKRFFCYSAKVYSTFVWRKFNLLDTLPVHCRFVYTSRYIRIKPLGK